ncbi:retropepsin-like aspartic protease family protein [Thioflexithrix psekupsensis]|nr:TIGR02281 family clan AA aspartic protease [Thioflexithrix psekupsensis]
MPASEQRIGKFMIAMAFIAILGLLSLFFDQVLEQRRNPNTQPTTAYHTDGYKEVVLIRNRSHHYLTTGQINGEDVLFLLDTGATVVSIPENVANRLNLKRGSPMLAQTANGTITTYQTQIDQVSIGDIRLHGVRASINPYMEGEEVLLGMSFLKQLTLIQEGNRLVLRQHQ